MPKFWTRDQKWKKFVVPKMARRIGLILQSPDGSIKILQLMSTGAVRRILLLFYPA